MSMDPEQIAVQVQSARHAAEEATIVQHELQSVVPELADTDGSKVGRARSTVLRAAGALLIGGSVLAAGDVAWYEYQSHHTVRNEIQTLPESQQQYLLPSPSATPETPEVATVPVIAPEEPVRIVVKRLGVDTDILTTEAKSRPDKNAWQGKEYYVDFPVDTGKQKARVAVVDGKPLFGEPNTLPVTRDLKQLAMLRTIIYGHASDTGKNLLFQHLVDLRLGDTFTIYTAEHAFTYKVYKTERPDKGAGEGGLANDPNVYKIPKDFRKEAALIACLPNSNNHAVVIGYLESVIALNQPTVKPTDISTKPVPSIGKPKPSVRQILSE